MTAPADTFQSTLHPAFLRGMAILAVLGCVLFTISIVIGDIVVPDHDWIADTISDLGAGRYEYIVDIGIYTFSAGLLGLALAGAHLHQGGLRWAAGVIGLGMLSLIVFLIGARNEYGDNDSDGVVIHVYLVYALGLIMALVPWLMSQAIGVVDQRLGHALKGIAVLWFFSAPVFFFLPDSIDGIYERGLGLISFAMVLVLASFFWRAADALNAGD